LPSVDIEVYFASGSARVTQRAAAILNPLGQALTDKRLAHATFLIAGHTDAKGSAEYNRELSRRRAEAVRQFLIERFGIDPQRLVSRGYGFDRLKTPGRPLGPENRRVQIVNLTSQVPR
jgi:outer membrane protein OmpA-like peptidoglycan-associated protein